MDTLVIPQEAIDRFERRAAEVRDLLRRARKGGQNVPSDAYLEDFLSRKRGPLIRMIAEALAQRAPVMDLERADEWTVTQRTDANLTAMQLLTSKPAASMTTADRKVLARYSGWGGLSIEKAQGGSPPSLRVDPVSLQHEYYTPTALTLEIARAVSSLLADLVGADGMIRALEPSAGIGRFIRAFDAVGSPPIRWTAVELSALAASMLAAVRPGLEIFTSSFESWVAQHGPEYVGRLNLVVANPPFGSRGEFKVEDPDRSYRESVAWAYFLRRGLDLLAPGGLGIYIIPMGFMSDPKRRKLREHVLLRHHLVSAFRLPSVLRLSDGRKRDLFPGTHNVTDLLFFRRRVGELVELDAEDTFIAEGRYFETISGHVLGTEDRSYRLQIIGPPVRLPAIVERPICTACKIRPPVAPAARATEKVDSTDPRLSLARALAQRIDAYFAALSGARGGEDPYLLWPELVGALRAFTAQYGSPLDVKNVRVLSRDRDVMRSFARAFEPDGGLLPSLRERPRQAVSAGPTRDPLALAEHLYRAERGLTLARLMQLYTGDETRESVLSMLLQSGWCVDGPGLTQLVPGEVYFTGDLWARYDRAVAHPDDRQAQKQARRLLDIIGPALLTDLGSFTLRESWIPLALVSSWISETINSDYPPVELTRGEGLVQVRGLDYQALEEHPRLSPDTISLLGWLNHDLVLYKPEKAKKMESLNEARARRAEGWDREFRDWIRGAPERERALMTAYNRHHRGFVVPTFSEDPLAIARWTRDPTKQLHDYQAGGVRRILENRGGLLVYDTGVGKTFTALAAIAAARQEGWVTRPVVIVPNAIVLQWRDEIATVLPDYRVVIIGANPTTTERGGQLDEESETDTPAERAQKWARFQGGEYDLALLTYSSMPRTRIDVDALGAMFAESPALQRQIALKRRNILDKKEADRTEREKAILKGELAGWILERLELPENWDYDGDVRWEDLGIDFLVIDEIHNFKNLFLPEPREKGVPAFMGSPGEGSARAWQLFFRAALVRRRTGGAGILGLSATPAKNGPIELYSVISYINPRAWLDLGIYDAENFVDQFCVLEEREIVTAAMRLEKRLAMVGFRRLRDLQSILRRFLDIKSSSEMARLGRLKKPKASSELVLVDLNDAQREKTAQYLGIYRQKIAEGSVGNFHLGMITRLGLVAIHPALDEGYKFDTALTGGEELPKPDDYSSPKFEAVAQRVLAQAVCGHIVFVEPLAAQVWLKETLIRAGIPGARIALLNAQSAPSAADRRKIAQAFNRGEYTVVIANAIAGEGANLQRRTCAVHNVDIPWDPMTRRQRNGRADRQGNENEALIVYDYLARRSGDGPRLAKLQGKSHWIEEVLESRDDVALNPAAQVSLSPIELLAELTEDAQETAMLLARVEEERRRQARGRLLRQVAALLRAADARFREAERAVDPLEAARLRQEGQRELTALKSVDAAIWPLYEQARVLERQPVLVSLEGVPFWDGLRLWSQRGGASTFYEFGRVVDGRIGHRKLGEATWTTVGVEGLTMPITPASYTGGWPEEGESTGEAIAAAVGRLGAGGGWEDLGWPLASQRFLEEWWPRFAEDFRDQLARRTWAGADELYPALTPDDALILVEAKNLHGLRLMPPDMASFERFLVLARGSTFKLHELRAAARLWWERTVPASVKAREIELAQAPDVEPRPVEPPPAPRDAGFAEAPPRGTPATPAPPTATTRPSAETSPPREVGHFWRIADRYYGDTALIRSMQAAGYPAEHAGFGFFDVVLPKGKISFNRAQDERLFEEQIGRLHTLDVRGDVDLPAMLVELEAAGHAVSGGEWETMPTSYPPPKEPILASVPPPPEPSFAAAAAEVAPEVEAEAEEHEAEEPAPAIAAEEGGLEFSIDPKELQGALNLIKRVSDPKMDNLSMVQIECHGHVFFRIGSPRRFFELRLQSTRCAAMGDATVEVKPLLDAARTLGKQRLTIRKTRGARALQLVAGARQVEIQTIDYTPTRIESEPVHVVSLPGDVLADLLHRTTYAIGSDPKRKHLQVLHVESDERSLRFLSLDGPRLAVASTPVAGAAELDGFQISRPAAERLEALIDQHLALARPRGRGTSRAVPPVQILVTAETPMRPRMLVFRSELFTFAAAHINVDFPSFERVVPALDNLGGIGVVAARELVDALAAVARTKDNAVLEFKDGLQITNKGGGKQPVLRFAVRDAFVSGPPLRIVVNPDLIQPAIAAASGDDRAYVGLAYQTDPKAPFVVTRWLADERPRDRREALAKIHEEVRTHNLAVVMPIT
ncbi:SNF2-related protein [Nannocystis pusilla]|uniref:DEAD/DEAH box helicase family protein n=1 Tax=Nannocystis pusilla TaxID=889268 RepID=A0ABS7TJ13_9BACT|nr:SNF2-related protein [Nannocystis pusilla]MBZ5708222.1 DEAD/DEAH box helicase family protein [Nannocystis pusilla]